METTTVKNETSCYGLLTALKKLLIKEQLFITTIISIYIQLTFLLKFILRTGRLVNMTEEDDRK